MNSRGTLSAACCASASLARSSSSSQGLDIDFTSTTRLFGLQQGGQRRTPAHLGQAPCTARSDSAYRNTKPLADLGIRHRRLLHEHRQQLAAGREQLIEGQRQHTGPFRCDDLFFDLYRLCGRHHLIGQPFVAAVSLTVYPQDPQAFPLGSGGQPAGKSRGLAKRRQLLDQAEPHILGDVVGVRAVQPVAAADRPHQRGVSFDDLIPRALVTLGGSGDQGGNRGIVSHKYTSRLACGSQVAKRDCLQPNAAYARGPMSPMRALTSVSFRFAGGCISHATAASALIFVASMRRAIAPETAAAANEVPLHVAYPPAL